MTPRIIGFIGQTATGKTARAVAYARSHPSILINADSRQIYTHLDIVTGKSDNPPDIAVAGCDLALPHERFSSHMYARFARDTIMSALQAGKVAVIVGGSTLYLHHLFHLPISEGEGDTQTLSRELNSLSVGELQDRLKADAPSLYDALNESDCANPHRLIRLLTKKEDEGDTGRTLRDTLQIGPDDISLTALYHGDPTHAEQRIRARVIARLQAGAIEEYERVRSLGYTLGDPGLGSIGYALIDHHLQGVISRDELISLWTTKEKQYAKRQKTYFKKYFPEATIEYV